MRAITGLVLFGPKFLFIARVSHRRLDFGLWRSQAPATRRTLSPMAVSLSTSFHSCASCRCRPRGHELCVGSPFPGCQSRLALNLTLCHKYPPRFGTSLRSAPSLPRNHAPSSPGNPCLPSLKELRTRAGTPDYDLSDNQRWAETTQRRGGYCWSNEYPVISGD